MPTKFLLTASAFVLVALGSAGPAWAHVSVRPAEAPRGGEAELVFTVPNERDDAATVQLEIRLPATFERVEAPPVDGWTAEIDGTVVRWQGGRIAPGATQQFPLAVGPLPDDDRLVFPAVQTYDSGEVVRWIDEDHDAARPAPALTLTGEPSGTTTTTTTTSSTTTTTDAPLEATLDAAGEPGEANDESGPSTGVLVALAVAALVAVGLAFVLLRRRAARVR